MTNPDDLGTPSDGPGLPEAPARKPHKKALLIGIGYQAERWNYAGLLKEPHTDVAVPRKLPIGVLDLPYQMANACYPTVLLCTRGHPRSRGSTSA